MLANEKSLRGIATELRAPLRRLSSGIPELDRALAGGLVRGALSEWGLLPGKHGLRVIAQFLLSQKPLTLWIFADETRQVYPPAWAALGVDLANTYFVCCAAPLKQLQAVFLEATFEVIILDRPGYMSPGDWGFLARQARKLEQTVLVLRPYALQPQRGNVQMRVRANTSYDCSYEHYIVAGVKGLRETAVSFNLPGLELFCYAT